MSRFSRAALVSYIADNLDNDNLAQEIAAFLIDNNKVSELDSIMRDVIELRASKDGVVETSVTSAFELDKAAEESIKSKVKTLYPELKTVIMHKNVDTSVIGGADIKFANANLDVTVRGKLNQLKESVL